MNALPTPVFVALVVAATGALTLGCMWVAAGVAVIAYRTHEHRRATRIRSTR